MDKSYKNLDLDFLLHEYVLRIWSAKSTPTMFWLYNLTAPGHEKSTRLPSESLRDTTQSVRNSVNKSNGFPIPPHKALNLTS